MSKPLRRGATKPATSMLQRKKVDSLTIRLTHLILNASTRMHILASEPSQCHMSVLQLQPALLLQSLFSASPAKHLLCFSEHYILVTKRQPCCKTGAMGLRGCCVTNGSGAFLFFFFLAALWALMENRLAPCITPPSLLMA